MRFWFLLVLLRILAGGTGAPGGTVAVGDGQHVLAVCGGGGAVHSAVMDHPVVRAIVFDAGQAGLGAVLFDSGRVWGEGDCATATRLLAAVEYAVKPHAVWRS